MIQKAITSFFYSVHGIRDVWKEEQNFRIAVTIGILVIIGMFYFNFSFVEKIFCILCITLVLTAEIINTVIEDVCNRIEPHTDPEIGKIKDMSSSFVLMSCIGAFIVGLLVFVHHFFLY